MCKNKFLSLDEALSLIKDGACIVSSGICMSGFPEETIAGLERKFLESGSPKHLNWVAAAGQGCWEPDKGLQHVAHEGLLDSMIISHYGLTDKLARMAEENKIIAYNLPFGALIDMYRAAAQGMPGHITKVGLKTYVDPRLEGGRLNERTKEDIVKLIHIEEEEFLMYRAPKIDVAIIRGTTADQYGNISFEEESLPADMRIIAMAARACGGKVICQVKYTCERLMTDQVAIPGIFVDHVVVAEHPEVGHKQSGLEVYQPSMSGHVFVPTDSVAALKFDAKKVIARRAAMELKPDAVINLGIGMPEGIANIAAEEGIADKIVMTSESGAIAGIPMGGKNFGSVQNAWATVEIGEQFLFYDGGGLDATFLGLAEVNPQGSVNVSRFGSAVTGCGGFINISQNTPNIIYCGTFTAGGLKEEIKGGKLQIIQEGRQKKFLQQIQQITFSGEFAAEVNQNVLYITERAVFKLVKDGLELIEIAPGVDLKKDILEQMEFEPKIAGELKMMDSVLFEEIWGGLDEYISNK